MHVTERSALGWLVLHTALFAVLGAYVASGLVGAESTPLSPTAALVLMAFVLAELLVPVAVYVDLRRLDEPNWIWVHAAALPIVNLFGLLAYLADRDRARGS